MTVALDRFLYECKADEVALRLEDMTVELSNALDELSGLDKDSTEEELREVVAYVLKQRGELERAADRAVDMVWDFVEENRPAS